MVHVGGGVRSRLPALVKAIAPSGRCALISDETVAGHWGSSVEDTLRAGDLEPFRATFPAGERFKTRETWSRLTDRLLSEELGRDGCVVSLGGGVVGDVAGFVAATYLRGIPFVQVATTTLAMIDASVGGKTGVDHPLGKNLVGAIHAPGAVLADPEFLTTLDPKRVAEGFAEAVKHGVLFDGAYATWLAARAGDLLAADPGAVVEAVGRSVELKAGVVSADEFEGGRRQLLNFGHTVGHALERATDFALPHGHAVAIGMVFEARLGEVLGHTAPGTASDITSLIEAFGLPTYHAALGDADDLVPWMSRDKKVRDGVVRFVFVASMGHVAEGPDTTVPVPAEALVRTMKSLGP